MCLPEPPDIPGGGRAADPGGDGNPAGGVVVNGRRASVPASLNGSIGRDAAIRVAKSCGQGRPPSGDPCGRRDRETACKPQAMVLACLVSF
jgi:hypothetical protein